MKIIMKAGFSVAMLLLLSTNIIAQSEKDRSKIRNKTIISTSNITDKNFNNRVVILEKFSDNGVFDGERTIRIVLPPDYYDNSAKYRVIYFFDGKRVLSGSQNNIEQMAADYYHDELLKEGLIHPAILVAMHDNGNRMKDLTPTRGILKDPGGDLEKFYNFIHQVLKPYIDSNFRTLKEASFTGIAGHSYGGLASAWLAYTHPETFGLAGCMSPSLWWDNEVLLKKMGNEKYRKNKSRFWFMSSDIENPDMWINTRRAAFYLKEKGWKEGGNLAYNHVYGGIHDIPSCNSQMRNMLYFLLRKEKPAFIGATIKNVLSTTIEPVNIDSLGENACLLLELQYSNRYKTNAIDPSYQSVNDHIAFMVDNISGRIFPQSAGTTKLRMTNGKAQASIAIQVFDCNNHEKYLFNKSSSSISIDAKLNDWGSLKYGDANSVDSSKQYRFDLTYDDSFLYVAVKVFDDTIFVDTTYNSQKRDRLAINLDARNERVSSLGRGFGAWSQFLSIGVSPGLTINDMILQREYVSGETLPADVKVASIIDNDGYVTEIAIPISYIVEKQGINWNSVRFNLYQKNINTLNGTIKRNWWRPDWKSPENYNGSGIFIKN